MATPSIYGILTGNGSGVDYYSDFENGTGSNMTVGEIGPFTIFSVFVLLMFVFIGLVGNSIVIFIIIKHRDMRTVTNYFVLNLAITDITLLIICDIPTAIVYALRTSSWPLGDFMCRVTGYVMNVSRTSLSLLWYSTKSALTLYNTQMHLAIRKV